jgi:hypothetical protein
MIFDLLKEPIERLSHSVIDPVVEHVLTLS